MVRLNQLKEEVLTLWNDQNVKLEMYIQWKAWERDALEVFYLLTAIFYLLNVQIEM